MYRQVPAIENDILRVSAYTVAYKDISEKLIFLQDMRSKKEKLEKELDETFSYLESVETE